VTRHAVLLMALLLTTACATPPRPFTDEFYGPLHVRASAAAALPVIVYAFTDVRAVADPTVVVRYERETGDAATTHATAPVGQGVARAFVRGLAARGYRVTDETARELIPQASGPGPAVITGRVAEFDAHTVRTGLITADRTRVGARVTLAVYDPATGRRVFERDYARVVQGAMAPTEPLGVLSRALADVVEQAVSDADLLRAVRSVN
jgi:hypothetical protein